MSNVNFRQARQQINNRRRRRFVFRLHLTLFVLGLMLFSFWLRIQPIGYPIYLLPPTLWAFLLIGHGLYSSSANSRDKAVDGLWENLYDTPDELDDLPPMERIRRQVEAELVREKASRRRLFFRINLAAYLGFLLVGWIVIPIIFGPFFTESAALTIFLLSFGGLAEVILHYMTIRLDSAEGERGLREQLLGRAIQEAGLDRAYPEKAKRVSHLSDDGELIESDDWEADESLKNQQSGA